MVRKLCEDASELFIRANEEKIQEIDLDPLAHNVTVQVNMFHPFTKALVVSYILGIFIIAVKGNCDKSRCEGLEENSEAIVSHIR